ncbi:thioredoxin-like associated protein 2, putative [Plasmodium ovale wallikeri]|uniref:Thioredoxin-like associated protein 2, putative n=2 Tax=Plasmodium ovale TaxID=36330 RepID=A0A1A8YND6_PLAOA|nr:thioredoxin-like associated protein 2, putative [Plasmodium ovale wallikeri]SBT33449.1 thioredoxin-like associated protein 2, putative [Plasmodium ovale wallikeri]SBT76176.1 thioredoxin-like associated protein 2, putative [Plasmodium ovale]
MYTSQRTNLEYGPPVVLNINNEKINAYKKDGTTNSSSVFSHNMNPLRVNYQDYESQNTSVNTFSSQNNFNRKENSKMYSHRYQVGNDLKIHPLKYSTSHYIPENRDERKRLMNIFEKMKSKEINKNTANYVTTNSVRIPTNNYSPINSTLKTHYKKSPESFNEIDMLTYKSTHSQEKENKVKYIPTECITDNWGKVSNVMAAKQISHIPLMGKSDDNSTVKIGENYISPNRDKRQNVTKIMSQPSKMVGDLKRADNLLCAMGIRKKAEKERGSNIREFEGGERAVEHAADVGRATDVSRADYLGEGTEKKKESIVTRGNRYKDDEDKREASRREVHREEVSPQEGSAQEGRSQKVRHQEEDASNSPQSSSRRGDKKIQFQSRTLTRSNSGDKVGRIISMKFNDDLFNLKNGLNVFENIVIVDRNNILKKWNGYEWKKLEESFFFFTKARYDNKGNIWCINNLNQILKLVKKKFKLFHNLSCEEIVDLSFDKNNILWCINRKGELLKWNNTQWKNIKYTGFHKLICLSFDTRGDLWAINSKRLLAFWSTKDNCWVEKKIKGDIKISSIDFDKNGRIWAISTSGALLTCSCDQWINFGFVCLEGLISLGFEKIKRVTSKVTAKAS